ncbi:CHASE3 domain-containing protein [Dactylosporangium aurantiacum]|uniref:CHASE3 domain-containing protein n=1 Tax=Dactylosporangium aurantiacum TaxID=35754 RepID=A0A9Q9ICY0_9ACTN|nr:CHASE3 domain-containing protein [Dactylosporangium aurantiacum]MDG6109682.1 CHASE3 domain-containing protein [Dactylosporangium aurantiacum]UWZ50295.1 CHASE3 domain-containing protein [Dactylosporangium aurantiacum]
MPKPIAAALRRQFAWLVVVLLGVAAARFLAGHSLADAHDGQLRRIADTQRANQRLLQDLTDVETGVRGYQLTGDPAFLGPFHAGASDYPAARDAALRAAPDDHTRVLVRDQDQAAQRWLAQVALPISALPPGHPGLEADRSARGRELFDEVRAANAAVAGAVDRAQTAATAAHRTAGTVLEAALALLALLSVLVAVRVYRSAARLLAAEARAVEQIIDGLGCAVLVCDAGGRVVHRNGVRFAGLDPFGDAGGHPVERALGGEVVVGQEVPLAPARAGAGPPVPVDARVLVDARPLTDGSGRVAGAVATAVAGPASGPRVA